MDADNKAAAWNRVLNPSVFLLLGDEEIGEERAFSRIGVTE